MEENKMMNSQPDMAAMKQMKKAIKKSYNWAAGGMLIQLVIAGVIAVIPSFFMGFVAQAKGMSNEEMLASLTTSGYLITVNAISYLVANVAAYFIGLKGAGRISDSKRLLQKSNQKVGNLALFAMVGLGLQGLSMVVQNIVVLLTHSNGMGILNMDFTSFGNNVYANIMIVIYFIVIAPITEEMMIRGMALRNCSIVSQGFGIAATAVMFGLMHGNMLQGLLGIITGTFLGIITVKSGSVRPAIICHAVINTNAMIINGLVYALGDGFTITLQIVYMIGLLIIGIAAFVVLWTKQRALFSMEKVEADKKKFTWPLLLTSPTFLIFALIYLVMIILGMVA